MSAGPFAKLVEAAKIGSEDRVLDVGCATGYSTAIIARLADYVTALESDSPLAAFATMALAQLGVENVRVVTGPLSRGWPHDKPYDVIFIGGSVEAVPDVLVSQLADGGRLVAIVGSGLSASACLYVRSGSSIGGRAVFNASAHPLPGFATPRTFVL
jgi:protein-L-isoaspartate(D-aspartate) O-methyltransferase